MSHVPKVANQVAKLASGNVFMKINLQHQLVPVGVLMAMMLASVNVNQDHLHAQNGLIGVSGVDARLHVDQVAELVLDHACTMETAQVPKPKLNHA
jgi:hypothetical protein